MSRKKIGIAIATVLALIIASYFILTKRNAGTGKETAAVADEHGHAEGEDEHEGDEEGEESHDEGPSGVVKKNAAQLTALGVSIATAEVGKLKIELELQGNVELNQDAVAHIVPRTAGVVKSVRLNLGDLVKAGEILAVLESRELADAKSAYLAARERYALAEATFGREKDLWNKKIASEQEFLNSKKLLSEARIEQATAKQKLSALGLRESDFTRMVELGFSELTRYEMRSPIQGTIIERHITTGEYAKAEDSVFVVADLTLLNVVLQVYPKDLAFIKKGDKVKVFGPTQNVLGDGTVNFVGAIVEQESRASKVMVRLDKPAADLRPGLFVKARVQTGEIDVPVLVPRTSLQTLEKKDVIFVESAEGFVATPVQLGRSNSTHVEVVGGLETGKKYVSSGGFSLKAEVEKGEAKHDH